MVLFFVYFVEAQRIVHNDNTLDKRKADIVAFTTLNSLLLIIVRTMAS